MSPETTLPSTPTTTKLCPTCGTRVSEDATRCLVCGADLGTVTRPARPEKAVEGGRMPMITLSLPAALGLLALFLAIGAVMVFFALKSKPEVVVPLTPTATTTITSTPTVTPTDLPPTATDTPLPTPTPISYTIQPGDSCLGIAGLFSVSVNSIILLNGLNTDCLLSPGKSLLIPQPTPTVTPLPSATLSAAESTRAACKSDKYTVVENDTPSGIANRYGVAWQAIKEENGLTSDVVFSGQTLIIPLCKKSTPVGGPTATPTQAPPYAAPNLLLPADGAPFTLADDSITLQWASVGTLRSNEVYAVTIEDITSGEGIKRVSYVTDTKFIVPTANRPNDKTPHVFRWTVITVRQTGTDASGNPTYEPAGAASAPRVFTWTGAGSVTPTP